MTAQASGPLLRQAPPAGASHTRLWLAGPVPRAVSSSDPGDRHVRRHARPFRGEPRQRHGRHRPPLPVIVFERRYTHAEFRELH
eukprot:12877525-Alexandrium_andersonii.AAC.1